MMTSITFFLKLFFFAKLAESVSMNETQPKVVFDIGGVCNIQGIEHEYELYDTESIEWQAHYQISDAWRKCVEVTIVDSNFEKLMFGEALFQIWPNLTKVEAVNVQLADLHEEEFVQATKLQHLNVSRNQIRHLPSKVFSLLPSLISVDLSWNLISSIDDTAFIGASATLTSIDLSFNKIAQFKESYLMFVMPLLSVNLEGNLLQHFVQIPIKSFEDKALQPHGAQHRHCILKSLNLQNNLLMHFAISCLEINELNLNDNHLATLQLGETPKEITADNNNLTEFSISERMLRVSLVNNKIENLDCELKAEMESLNLSGNKLSNESLVELSLAGKLKILDLSNNKLPPLTNETFANLSLLEELNLAETGIGDLSTDLLAHQGNLKALNISHNNLGSIDQRFLAPLRNLTTLDINGNDLIKLGHLKNLRQLFPLMTKIALIDNNWSCTYLLGLIMDIEEQGIQVEESAKFDTNAYKNAKWTLSKRLAKRKFDSMFQDNKTEGISKDFLILFFSAVLLFTVLSCSYKHFFRSIKMNCRQSKSYSLERVRSAT